MSPHPTPRLSLLLAAALILLACDRTPVPTASPTATPTTALATPDPALQARFSQAGRVWSEYRPAEARTLLEGILAQDPTFPGAGRLLGLIEFRCYRNYGRAVALLQQAAALPGSEASDWVLLGDAWLAQGRQDEAIAAYRQGIDQDPASTYLLGRLGEAYLARGDRALAREALERAVALDPYASPAGERLHRLYVEEGRYAAACRLWQAANMAAGGAALPGNLGKWGALYRQALEGEPAGHLALGRLYATLRLYDEAALELERAQQEAPADDLLAQELQGIRVFLRFRDEMAAYLDSFYREEALAGQPLSPTGLGAIYSRVAVLFPDLQKQPYSDAWFYEIGDALGRHFGALIRFQTLEGHLNVYFGYVAGSQPRTVSHWGKEYTTRLTWLKGMVSRGFMHWYTYGTGGTGGWCFEPEDAVLILDGRYAGAADLYRQATDPQLRDQALARSRAADPNLQDPDPLAVFYSPYLGAQLALKAVDEAIARTGRPGLSAEDARTSAILRLADADSARDMAHEGQHALDETYLRPSVDSAENQEYRSKIAELVYGDKPFASLYQFMVPYLGAPDIPHGVADAWVFQDLVRQVSEHPERYPAIDALRNILLQLPALSEEEVRQLAAAAFDARFPSPY